MEMNKILITGASGFIGSNLLQYYEDKGFYVANIDKAQPRRKEYSKNWRKINILDYNALESEITSFQPEIVIHLAARTDLNGKKLIDYDSNTIGTKNLIKVLTKVGSVKRVIFTSSMLVCKLGYIPKNASDYAPSTAYGESKVLMENIIHQSQHSYEWTIVRPTSIWGPWFGEPYRNFFEMIIRNRYFHIGGKSCTRTYGYVENLLYQIDSILNAPVDQFQGKVFYLGDYNSTNINNWANEIASELGIIIKTIPYPLVKLAALGGDVLKFLNIYFPMSSFRLKNMTTDNPIDLTNTLTIAPNLPFSRIDGIKRTLFWLKNTR
jgi:nucleoside-diphosphate-sugar epimerase